MGNTSKRALTGAARGSWVLWVGMLVVALAGCGAAADVAPDRKQHRFTVTEQHYLDGVYSMTTMNRSRRLDRTLVRLGHHTCDALDDGATFDDISAVIAADGPAVAEEAIAAVVSATETLCPEYGDERDAWSLS